MALPDLPDIAPGASDKIELRGREVEVFGVDAAGLVYLMRRYPALQKMLSRRRIDAEGLINMAGADGVAAIIAAGLGHATDAGRDKVASWRLVFGEQVQLMTPIILMTMPGGLDPFLMSVQKLGAGLGAEELLAGSVEVAQAAQ